jgi:hypothetical protein
MTSGEFVDFLVLGFGLVITVDVPSGALLGTNVLLAESCP